MPLIVDIDTGGGSVLNATRTARDLYEAGAAAIQIEDQQDPKRCGLLEGRQSDRLANLLANSPSPAGSERHPSFVPTLTSSTH